MNTGVALNFGLPFDMYIKSIHNSSDHYKYLIWGRKTPPPHLNHQVSLVDQ